MKKFFVAVILVLVAAGTCIAGEPIRIGVSMSLTGKEALIGNMQKNAFKLWETHVNKGGGILGRQIQLTVYDDKSDKETAKILYQRMIEKEKMDLLFAPYSSGIMAAVLPITEEHHYPMLASGAGADSIFKKSYRYVFGIFPPASIYSLGFLEMALASGFKNVAIISTEEPFGKNIGEGAEKYAKRLGMTIVQRVEITKGSAEQFDKIAKEARDAGAQALLMCGHFNESVSMRKAMKNIHWYPKAYWASAGPAVPAYYKALGTDANKSFSSTQWKYYDKLPYPGAKEFYKSFVAAYKADPSYHAATAYAAGTILKAAIEKAGSLNREKIRDILSALDMMTILGRYGVDSTGLQIRYFHLITQWINGRQEVVWPIDLRTAPPQF